MRRSAVYLFAVVVSLAASSPYRAAAQTTPAPANTIACSGPFGRDATHASLVAAFGAANVVQATVDGAEGEDVKATVLFPKDPKRRIEVFWEDEEKRTGPTFRFTAPSNWVLPLGLTTGQPIDAVEKANGRPFLVSGFGWDYGGEAFDWKGGVLDKALPGGCVISVGFVPGANPPAAAFRRISGDGVKRLSNHTDMRAVKPSVRRLTLSYPH